MIYKLTKEQLDKLTNKIKGGLSDNKTIEDIAKKHGVSISEIEKQLEKGIKVELEHTNDEKIAKEIALDHLYELPDYYSRLSRIEEKTDYSKEKESGLHGWFSRRGGDGSKGWIDCNTCRKDSEGKTKCKPCGREKGEKRSKYPACRPTPSACKTKGKGETWGKKSESINEVEQSEIDRILDKINQSGFDSLTNSEKMTLDNSQNKEFNSKELLINKIKEFISNEGMITMGELNAETSPVYKSVDQEIHLIEKLFNDSVEVVVYGGYKYETEEYDYEVPYEKLNIDTLDEIYDLIKNYEPLWENKINEFFKLPSEIERENKKEISEEKLKKIRKNLSNYGLVINNEFTREQEDYIEYYFDVESNRYEGRESEIRNIIPKIANNLNLDYGFHLNRNNLFYFFDDSSLTEDNQSIKITPDDLKDSKNVDAVKDMLQKDIPVELTKENLSVNPDGKLEGTLSFNIEDVSTAMDIVDEYEKNMGNKNVITWYEDKLINNIINFGVKMKWLFRPSVTQVEWTEKGIEELRNMEGDELVEGKKDRCYNIAKRKYDKNSAYRSGAIVRCRRGEIWKNESKEEIKKEIKEMVENHLKPTITKGDFVKLILEIDEKKNYEIEVIEQDPVGGSKYCEVRIKYDKDDYSHKIDYFVADLNNNVIQYHPYIYEYEDEIRKLGYNLPIIRKRGEDEFECECTKTIKFKSGMNFFRGFEYICKWDKERKNVTVSFEDGRFTTMSNEVFDDHFDIL